MKKYDRRRTARYSRMKRMSGCEIVHNKHMRVTIGILWENTIVFWDKKCKKRNKCKKSKKLLAIGLKFLVLVFISPVCISSD